MADDGVLRSARIALAVVLAMLLQGCEVFAMVVIPVAYGVAQAGYEAADAADRESDLQAALTSRTFAYPPNVVGPALQQAAQLDGRSIERGSWVTRSLIVSYPASPPTDGAAGSIAVKSYSRGQFVFSTTIIVLRGPDNGSGEAGRKAGEQLLDAIAADLADIDRQVTTKTVAVDIGAVFDALEQVGQDHGRKVLSRDAASHALRVSFPFFVEGRVAEGGLDITCVAEGSSTIVTLFGDGKSPALDVRKAANALLGELTQLLRQPD